MSEANHGRLVSPEPAEVEDAQDSIADRIITLDDETARKLREVDPAETTLQKHLTNLKPITEVLRRLAEANPEASTARSFEVHRQDEQGDHSVTIEINPEFGDLAYMTGEVSISFSDDEDITYQVGPQGPSFTYSGSERPMPDPLEVRLATFLPS